jgi:nucleoside-diphosphate-sugar epimerase
VRVLVVGAGFVGTELGRRLVEEGHEVVGTTTTEAKVSELQEVFTEVHVLRGSDAAAVAVAAKGVDAVVVAAGPAAQRAMSVEDRRASYREVLADTAVGVSAGLRDAGVSGTVVVLSSLSVYGDAADHLDEIDESAPTTASEDPSPFFFQLMERTYTQELAGQVCTFRCADIYGGEDPPIEVKVRGAHDFLGGSVPFKGESLFYRVAVEDVLGAIEHAIATGLRGTYNLTHPGVPSTNRERFDAIGAGLGLPPLVFRDEIASPTKPISVAALSAAGFTATRTRVERA